MPIFRQPNANLEKTLATMAQNINELTLAVRTMNVSHETLTKDQSVLETRVGRNEAEIRDLQKSDTKIETVTKIVQYGGIALISGIVGLYTNLSSKIDTTSAKTDTNAITIATNERNDDDDQKQIDDLKVRVAKNREDILTAMQKYQVKKGADNE